MTGSWPGFFNARDLGGLGPGGATRYGRFIRASHPELLEPQGWEQLVTAGIRTVVDLRNTNEISQSERPALITIAHRPIEDQADREFMGRWGALLGSPRYYRENLERWPDKILAVFQTFAEAEPGGVLFHCASGRDRTGLITALLLRLGDVPVQEVVDDYLISLPLVNNWMRAQHFPPDRPMSDAELEVHSADAAIVLAELLEHLNVFDYLLGNGMSAQDIRALRRRLLTE